MYRTIPYDTYLSLIAIVRDIEYSFNFQVIYYTCFSELAQYIHIIQLLIPFVHLTGWHSVILLIDSFVIIVDI